MKINDKFQLTVGGNVSNWVSEERFLEEEKARLNTQDRLAITEETVEVLEGLLQKVTAELLKVQGQNRLLDHLLRNASPAPAAPPYMPGIQPWVWPKQPSDNPTPWTFLGVCQDAGGKPVIDLTGYLEQASKIVEGWPEWKKLGSDANCVFNRRDEGSHF